MHSRGFTLIELVTCIVIAGVLMAIAAPKFLDDQPFKERGYVDEVVSALRYSRQIAISTECEVSVAIAASGAYSATQRTVDPTTNTCDPSGAFAVTVKRGDGQDVSGTPPSGTTISPQRIVIFDKQGHASAGPDLMIGGFTIAIDKESGWLAVTP